MKKDKLLLIFLLLFVVSCNKKSNPREIFITSKDYYWQYSDTRNYSLGCGIINYRFEEDGTSHEYNFATKKGYFLNEGQGSSDLVITPGRWFIEKDSTFIWNNISYKIEHIDKTVIVLFNPHPKDKKDPYWIRLLKVVGEK